MAYADIMNAPKPVQEFLTYHSSVKGHSEKTLQGYYQDIKILLVYLKISRGLVPADTPFDKVDISDVGTELMESVTLSELYGYLDYSPDKELSRLSAATRSRRVSAVRSFYGYLTKKMGYFEKNVALELETSKKRDKLPVYLEESECKRLLEACTGRYGERDYCMVLLFLTCGLRVSELVGLNVADAGDDRLRVTGKGGKERIVYFSPQVSRAIDDWLAVRDGMACDTGENALFISRDKRRISVRGVEKMINKRLLQAGLDADRYSPHKLRHTAATLMLENGIDTRVLQEVLGHKNLNTTQIYTHIDNEGLRAAAAANPIGRIEKGEK